MPDELPDWKSTLRESIDANGVTFAFDFLIDVSRAVLEKLGEEALKQRPGESISQVLHITDAGICIAIAGGALADTLEIQAQKIEAYARAKKTAG